VENALYHVLLEGRKVGPYDRRTIVGMRIKNALTSDHVLVTTDGMELTVSDLVKLGPGSDTFQPNRSGSYSIVHATYSASLVALQGRGYPVPAFKGEMEARVQKDVLRLAGRFRSGLGWKTDRVKLPLDAVVHARVRGTVVDLWMRNDDRASMQRMTLELFTPESAGEFVDWLPNATPWPEPDSQPAALPRHSGAHPMLWGAVVGGLFFVGAILVWVLSRRVY
jgi:hypothetical protein